MGVSRIRMPLFAYFAVVAPALLALLLAAEAVMGPPGPMPLASGSPVLVARESVQQDPVQVLTVRQAIAVPASALAAQENTERRPEAQPEQPAKKVAAAPKRKRTVVSAREQERRGFGSRDFDPRNADFDRRSVYAFEPRQRGLFSLW